MMNGRNDDSNASFNDFEASHNSGILLIFFLEIFEKKFMVYSLQ